MADNVNVKVIVVDHVDLNSIMTTFSELVHDKFYKSIPYKDYTKLKKYNKEVEFRFYPEDGAVLAVPVEEGSGLLWWGKKTDDSFGSFLWGHFQEELKEMTKDDKKFKYDLFGELSNSTADSAKATSSIVATNDYIGDLCYDGKTAYDSTTTATSSWHSVDSYITTEVETQVDMLKRRVEELGKLIKDSVAEVNDNLSRKVEIADFEYGLADLHSEIMDHVDDARYSVVEVSEELRDLKQKIKDNQKTKAVVYDQWGVPHEVEAELQSTSSNCYPVKNYKIDIKADYMSACDNGKEKNNMDTNKMFNGFECGPVDDRIKMSPYGMAIRNADGRYVSYDAKNGNIMDVEVFNFDNHKLIWKMPVAVSAIAVGDTVIHMKKPMFVTSITNGITVIDIFNGEVKTIVPAQNMFGFNFVTKVVSLFNFTGDNTPTAENPFGNIMPFMLMGNEDMDMKDFFMMMAVANGGNMNAMFQNPFMMYAMMNDNGDMKEMLPFMLWGQTGLFGQAPVQHQCHCGQHNGENH